MYGGIFQEQLREMKPSKSSQFPVSEERSIFWETETVKFVRQEPAAQREPQGFTGGSPERFG